MKPTNKRAVMQAALMILCGAGLTACGQDRVRLVKPPIDLMTCADEPTAPNIPGRDAQDERDRLVFDYVLALRGAWGDCRSKVDGVRAWAGEG